MALISNFQKQKTSSRSIRRYMYPFHLPAILNTKGNVVGHRQNLTVRASRALAVEHNLVLRVAHIDALVVCRAAVRAWGRAVLAAAAATLGRLCEAVGQLVGRVVATAGACGARADLLEFVFF